MNETHLCACGIPQRTAWTHARVREGGKPACLWALWCLNCGGQVRLCGIADGFVYLNQTTPRGNDSQAGCICGTPGAALWERLGACDDGAVWGQVCGECRGYRECRLFQPGEGDPALLVLGEHAV